MAAKKKAQKKIQNKAQKKSGKKTRAPLKKSIQASALPPMKPAVFPLEKLGPLRPLVGVWEGQKGDDIAPDDSREGIENNKFRERIEFVPIIPVDNHEQKLFGLRYKTTVWRLTESDPFHEEVGYWLWDPKEKQVMKSFIVPRGIVVLAGGTVEPSAQEFNLSADAGSSTYGICSNLFLDREFKTVRYELNVKLTAGEFRYFEDTQMKMPGRADLFHHTDENALRRSKAL
jgi:hypothetical protein